MYALYKSSLDTKNFSLPATSEMNLPDSSAVSIAVPIFLSNSFALKNSSSASFMVSAYTQHPAVTSTFSPSALILNFTVFYIFQIVKYWFLLVVSVSRPFNYIINISLAYSFSICGCFSLKTINYTNQERSTLKSPYFVSTDYHGKLSSLPFANIGISDKG